ncbi:RES family NAD+ phosphorylase [Niallia sp. FSL R7-0271]|uniref:RES family NAD+ phosphorylase n=1 Tax=Niallia sp. FSL R7-0271 TaxID=2921678 RepID=UPI0030FB3007
MEDIYCNNCYEYSRIFEILDDWNIYDIHSTIRGFVCNDIQECSNCNNSIVHSSYIITNQIDFEEEISKLIAERLSKEEIGECQYCNVDKIIYTQKYGDVDDLETVYDLIEGYDLPNEIKQKVYKHIYCSSCHNKLESDQPYVTSYEVDRWYQVELETVVQTFDITKTDGNNFILYLLENPMLGLNHPVGQKIFNMIKTKKISGISLLESGERLYRGRKRNNFERMAAFIPEELWNPPEGLPVQGRYNPPGISTLYLADNQNVIINELNLNLDTESLDIAEFLILKDMLIWDVRELDIEIFNSIPSLNKRFVLNQEYVFPNFIAQCLMANNYKGIIYNSTRGEGANYCLFNYKRSRDLIITEVIPSEKNSHFRTSTKEFRELIDSINQDEDLLPF